jgi:hypothetical protein
VRPHLIRTAARTAKLSSVSTPADVPLRSVRRAAL